MAGKYSRVTAEITDLEVEGLDAIVRSRLMFDLNPDVTSESAMALIRERGKKMGILIRSDQHLDAFRTWAGSDWSRTNRIRWPRVSARSVWASDQAKPGLACALSLEEP